MKRIETGQSKDLGGHFLDCLTINAAIKELEALKGMQPDEATFDFNVQESWGDHDICVSLRWKEEETDKQYEDRLALINRSKEHRKGLYENLKKEFGDV